jgi:hypothetical protein
MGRGATESWRVHHKYSLEILAARPSEEFCEAQELPRVRPITEAQRHVARRQPALQVWRQLHPLIGRDRREGCYAGALPTPRRGLRTNGAGRANTAPMAPNLSVDPSAFCCGGCACPADMI